jgi:hypothetical protein
MLIIVYLDRSKKICVTVATGWNDITRGEVIIKSETGNATFDFAEALGQVYSVGGGMFRLE